LQRFDQTGGLHRGDEYGVIGGIDAFETMSFVGSIGAPPTKGFSLAMMAVPTINTARNTYASFHFLKSFRVQIL
jgi:hypothetical protein